MSMRLTMATGLLLAGIPLLVAPEAGGMAKIHGRRGPAEEEGAVAAPAAYACGGCRVMSLKPGTCPMCQRKMDEMHVLGTKDGQALLCDCAAGCTACAAKSIGAGPCACGKDVVKVSAFGLHACPMGCAALADQPGACPVCGMELKQVD
jgi:hypothetical protein